jgi:Trypsin-like peptidase domain
MRQILLAMLVFSLLFAAGLKADEAKTETVKPTAEQFREQLGRSTLAIYHGEQKCAWEKETFFIFQIYACKCKFQEDFVCTATVIGQLDSGRNLALTAGHCFDWTEEDKYYVADNTNGKPVLHKANILKFENDERYDYGLISFTSARDYTPIAIEGPDASSPSIGTQVINVNISYGIVKEFAEGKVVSELIQGDAGGRCEDCKGRYMASIGLGPGASGSAVVNVETQEIVGIAEAAFPDTQMPTMVMPMGSKFIDFFDDDSAGLKPLPEGPKPKDPDGKSDSESELGRMVYRLFSYFFFFL